MRNHKKLKIGGIKYKLHIAHEWKGREGADGETFYDGEHGNAMFIGAELTLQAKHITLLHEAMHNMNSTMNHEFLDSLAEQMYQFLYDNNLLNLVNLNKLLK